MLTRHGPGTPSLGCNGEGSADHIFYICGIFAKVNERNEVKFNMRLRLRDSDSDRNFRQPPQNGVDNCGV